MSNEKKTPQAGEYWFPKRGKPFLCIAANDRGDTVWQDWVDTYYLYGDDCMWKHWHHEPRCDSFDWVEPPAIDPGEGYRIVDRDEEWLPTDERAYSDCITGDDTDWGPISLLFEDRKKSPTVADIAKGRTGLMVRRRKSVKTAIDPGDGWELLPVGTMLQEGDEFESGGDWNKTCYPGTKSIKGWTYRRRKPPAEVWPKYYVGRRWRDEDAYVRVDNATDNGVWVDSNGDAVKTLGKYGYQYVKNHLESWGWLEVTEAEALARVKPAEQVAQPVERTATPLVNAAVESPDDWVDLPETHILRADIDQVLYEHDTINYWQEVCPSAGMRLNDSQYKRARCRRRDLPAPQPKLTPVRLFVSADVRWGDRYIVSVKDGNPNPKRHQEVKFDGSRFYVEGIE